MTGDCRHCKDWRGCIGQWYSTDDRESQKEEVEWYSYGEICWCPHQVFWILKHSEDFDCGRWPKPPRSLECDAKKHTMIVTEAAFCRPKRIIGEVRARLTIANRKSLRRVLVEQAINKEKLTYADDDVRQLVYYSSGSNRRRITFNDWNKAKNYYQKGNKYGKQRLA